MSDITIALDAGHGGSDYGAIREGINEKDITWRNKLSANLYKFKYRKEWEYLKEYLKQNYTN